ncbi:MAG: YkgJ family cysteine cluster protein [Candidatus Micrarchaeia archaeon]|jgi:Fe-S-cluster containining protein
MYGLFLDKKCNATGACSKCQANCCKSYLIALTSFDLRRIYKKTNSLDFFTTINADNFDTCLAQSFILFEKDAPKEYFLVLSRKKNGSCIFLGKDNLCAIYNERPIVCRIYPFRYRNEKILYKDKIKCPAEWEITPKIKEEFLKAHKMQLEELKSFGARCREWNANHSKTGNLELFLKFILQQPKNKKTNI